MHEVLTPRQEKTHVSDMTCSSQICSKLPDGSGPYREQHSKQKVHNNMYPVKNQRSLFEPSLFQVSWQID